MATNEVNEIWNDLLLAMNQNPDIANFAMMNGFLNTLIPRFITDDSFMLSIGDAWAKEFIENNYVKHLDEELEKKLGHPCKTIVVLDESSSESTSQQGFVDNRAQQTSQLPAQAADAQLEENPVVAGESTRVQAGNGDPNSVSHIFHNPSVQNEPARGNQESAAPDKEDKTFDNFVTAETNRMAYGAAVAVAENPGVINNPLFIYGRSGLGKTHLLLAIKEYVNSNNPGMRVFYSPATMMIEDYVSALQTGDWSEFTYRYRTADMLLLDDVQFLERAEEVTNEFFKIFNQMTNEKRQIVLSADRPPKDIKFDERVSSRFASGVIADVQAPKFETKMTIFRNNIEYLKEIHGRPDLNIPNDVATRVVELSNSNIRNLEGAAASLVVYISYGREDKKEPISVGEAEEIVSKIFFNNMSDNKVTISDIQQFVESYYNVTHGELLGSTRPRNISHARQVGMYLARTLTQASYPDIGKAFKKDHSSVVHACKNIENKRQTNKDFFNELERMADQVVERQKVGL